MIHYHGGPIWPQTAAVALWQRRHGMTSFARPEQVALMAELCQSFVLDNGAFSHWKSGKGEIDVQAYAAWVREWESHPGFDWCVIPDTIEGDEAANDSMLVRWFQAGMRHGVPVFHMHEDLARLRYLMQAHDRIALGSSGQWATVGSDEWWDRMSEIMAVACDEEGRPRVKLHGLRMLSPTVFSHLPLSSADSCGVALNIGVDQKWRGPYAAVTESQRAMVLAERIELHASASIWSRKRGIQQSFALIG